MRRRVCPWSTGPGIGDGSETIRHHRPPVLGGRGARRPHLRRGVAGYSPAAEGRSAALPAPSGYSQTGQVAREALPPIGAARPAQGGVGGARTETQGLGPRCGRRGGRRFRLFSPAPPPDLPPPPRSHSLQGAAPRPSRRGVVPYLQGPSPPSVGTRLLGTTCIWFPCCCVGSRM